MARGRSIVGTYDAARRDWRMRIGARGIALLALLALAGFAGAFALTRALDGGGSESRASAPELPDPGKAPATRNLERVIAFPPLLERQGGGGEAAEAAPTTEVEPSQPGSGYAGGGGSGGGSREVTPVPEEEDVWDPFDPLDPAGGSETP
jgi:hypothetical protein